MPSYGWANRCVSIYTWVIQEEVRGKRFKTSSHRCARFQEQTLRYSEADVHLLVAVVTEGLKAGWVSEAFEKSFVARARLQVCFKF